MSESLFGDPLRFVVTVPNPEGIHRDLMRDDVSDALVTGGFQGVSVDSVSSLFVPSHEPEEPLDLTGDDGFGI